MTEKSRKVLSFPSPVPPKADYQRVKSSYSVREIKQLFGLSERTVRRWTESGIIEGTPAQDGADFTYDFQALTLFRRVREMRSQGLTIKQIEAELQGQLSLFRPAGGQIARLLTPFEEALMLHEQGDAKAAEFYGEAIGEGDNVAEAQALLLVEADELFVDAGGRGARGEAEHAGLAFGGAGADQRGDFGSDGAVHIARVGEHRSRDFLRRTA